MFKKYPDDQVVRALLRFHSEVEKNKGLKALDIGTGAGRHAKLLFELGFDVTALDLDPVNISDAQNLFSSCGIEGVDLVECNFDQFHPKDKYDVIVAWNFLYAYNESVNTAKERLIHIHNLLNDDGHLIVSMKTDNDTWKYQGISMGNGIVDNPTYGTFGNIFLNQDQMIDLFDSTRFDLEYFETYSRGHDMLWRNRKSNDEWRKKLPIGEEYYSICARKI